MSRRSPQAEPGGAFARRSLFDPELLRRRQERQNQNSQDALRAVWNRGKHSTDAGNANQGKAPNLHPKLHADRSPKLIATNSAQCGGLTRVEGVERVTNLFLCRKSLCDAFGLFITTNRR